MASLIIENGTNQGCCYPLGQRITVIGRAESLLIQILDEKVSRRHLQIRYDNTNKIYIATDMKSKHGVWINSMKITEETILKDNDRIQIGDTALIFTIQDFPDTESALNYFKKVGQRRLSTLDEP
ncbi:MAG: FHA domain-containing protein [Anaerohalosphaeraceae bacterium]